MCCWWPWRRRGLYSANEEIVRLHEAVWDMLHAPHTSKVLSLAPGLLTVFWVVPNYRLRIVRRQAPFSTIVHTWLKETLHTTVMRAGYQVHARSDGMTIDIVRVPRASE